MCCPACPATNVYRDQQGSRWERACDMLRNQDTGVLFTEDEVIAFWGPLAPDARP